MWGLRLKGRKSQFIMGRKFPLIPETEVAECPSRKKYSAKYKLQILNEIDSSAKTGGIGAVLRREGLYSSTVAKWRIQKEKGQLEGLSPKKRGPKSNLPDSRDEQIKVLELQNRKLQFKLIRAHLLPDIQKKISEMTGISLSEMEDERALPALRFHNVSNSAGKPTGKGAEKSTAASRLPEA